MLLPDKLTTLLSVLSRQLLVKRYKSDIDNSQEYTLAPKLYSKESTIGRNSFIGQNCYFDASDKLNIGQNTLIAPNVFITTRNHRVEDKYQPIIKQGYAYKPVVIEDDCWIGFGAKIMPSRIGCWMCCRCRVCCYKISQSI